MAADFSSTWLASDSICVFGISKRPESLPTTALQINAFFDGRNYMMLSAPQNRLYWFLFKDMRLASGSDIPRFTKDDEAILTKGHFSDQVTESTTFGDVYRNRLQTALVPLEEHVFQRWHLRRTICIGDAAHKVFLPAPLPQYQPRLIVLKTNVAHRSTPTPPTARQRPQTVLVNALVRRLDRSPTLHEDDIGAVFAEVQARRFARAASSLEQGRRTSSVSMRDTLPSRLFVHCLLAWFRRPPGTASLCHTLVP
ncbi:hypothetical protein INS49_010515 [Diaporthe citri]|uniref:uncharacterized protein n=1 Tax=Diaporthe citri TaxID=83186 RepID=UPI001C81B828|nr:uncharacterized protein INS49_010515 [Diaporthe citri]KAG6362285.1 hypothetical protein INS49_010515 [Diaporthe citri]